MVKTKTKKRTLNRTKLNLYLDLLLVMVFVFEMEVGFTGLGLHELLGLAFAGLLILHIVLHWSWVVTLTRTFFKKLIHESRLNYLLDWLLLVAMGVATVSGIVVSRTLGLKFGLSGDGLFSWQIVHSISSQSCLIITALHIAIHWKWIVANSQKYLFSLPNRLKKNRPILPHPATTKPQILKEERHE